MIKLSKVSKSYGKKTVVNQVDLSVSAGESVAVIGHNGAGKTTLMKLILGLVRPSSGVLDIATEQGKDPHSDIGFLPETVFFQGEMTGRQVLEFYAKLKQAPRHQCTELMAWVGLNDSANARVKTYSKGMRQRLGLAQALLGKPKLLLLDEPTTGLDPFLRHHFYQILRNCQAKGTAILISSHALSEIEGKIDKVLIMKQGQVVIQGTLDQLREAAKLPTQIRVIVLPGKELIFKGFQQQSPHAINGEDHFGTFSFQCQQHQTVELMNVIMAQQANIKDVQIIPPRLDDLYAHFVGKESHP
ncbi:MAG: ABC transporter ATP-binding protein [Pseudomonadales bacterium]|nr:ABC transporter ATP-binding protein [Pseudomonadales bacterium]